MQMRISVRGTASLALFVALVASGCSLGKTEQVEPRAISPGRVTPKLTSGPGTLAVFAGVPSGIGSANGTGATARFNSPFGVAVDGSGNVYVADYGNSIIRKITPAGVVTTLAGTAGATGSADGTGAAARFAYPSGVAVDGSGNVYVADYGNSIIRKITPAGVVNTLAGTADATGSADGTGAAARFKNPSGIAVDGSGNVYVADYGNSIIRKITPAGVVTTLAGTAGAYGSADGTGAAAQFRMPQGVAVDGSGNVYVADTNNCTIRKITPARVVTTLAGAVGASGSFDGTGVGAWFYYPTGVAVDGSGNVYVADTYNSTIRKVTPAGVVTTLAGTAGAFGSADGAGAAARFSYTQGVAVDASGNSYVADRDNSTIRKVTPAGVVTTLAGTAGAFGSADGTGAAARFINPRGVAVDGSGNVYVADTSNSTIRKVTPAGVVTTLAGTAGAFGSADGTGAAARFNSPWGVAVDGSSNVFVADSYNSTIRKITPAGVVTTLAGTAGARGSADGTGAAARFYYPQGVAVDGSGNVYVADTSSYTIRKITPAGVVTTLAGTAGVTGSADGTGAAALFGGPVDVAVDGAGNVYVADVDNNTIRKITPAGVVTTLAGTAGAPPGTADGTGAAARFFYPVGVTVDGSGNVYVADWGASTIRKITPTSVVSTLIGTPVVSGNVPGPLPATLYLPSRVAVDPATGSLYITVDSAVLVASNPLAISSGGSGPLTIGAGSQRTISASGGTGPYTWTLSSNNSGGSISAGGVYIAGSTGGVTDTITVTDSTGTSTTITIAVASSGSGVWTSVGAMAAARDSHSTTLLPSGKLLVAGGFDGAGNLASAELYDPATGTWSPTGSLATPRRIHTSTLLPSGKVLVTGGYGGGSSAEIYDPATGAWSPTGSMAASRWLSTSTLLPSGKVLVVGGHGGYGSAELYEPTTGTWTATGSLNVPRYGHVTVLLSSGKVLVAGGWAVNQQSQIADSELYDPATGTWSVTGSLTTPRGNHSATLLFSGKVLVLGAYFGSATAELYDPTTGTWSLTGSLTTARSEVATTLLPSGKVLAASGSGGSTTLVGAELYDPATGTWSPAASLLTGRNSATATLLPSGAVLVTGGYNSSTGRVASAEQYDPSVGSWTATGSLATARHSHTLTVLPSGKVLAAGGWSGTTALASAELFDPASGSWSTTGSLATARYIATATLLPSGRVLVAGGQDGATALASAELYDPATGTWSTTGSLSVVHHTHTATLLASGKVLIVGGLAGGAVAELYDPATGNWSLTSSLSATRWRHTATRLLSGKVLVAGGDSLGGAAELYDPSTGTWTVTGALHTTRYGHAATLLASGKVLVAGGWGGSNASAELYDPATGTWSYTGSLLTSRPDDIALLLPSGKAMVLGAYGESPIAELYDPATGTWSSTAPLRTPLGTATAAVLASGRVLVAGGSNWSSVLSKSETFDEGRGALPAWTPAIIVPPTSVAPGSLLTLGGTLLTGISEGSSGDSRASATNYPLVSLQAANGGDLVLASTSAFTPTSLTALVPQALLPGPYWARAIVSGVPSSAMLLNVALPLAISPGAVTIDPGFQRTFTALGGAPPYAWSLSVNGSGGSITSAGLYSAGLTGSVTDTIAVTDSLGSIRTALITVPARLTIANGGGGAVTVGAGGQLTLTASGGSGPYTWTMTTNGSGGSVTPGGFYTAGPNGGTDTITVTDANGGSTTITITVTPGGGTGGGGEARGAPALGMEHVGLAGAMLALLGLALAGPRRRVRRR
jgi:hypothetical protein